MFAVALLLLSGLPQAARADRADAIAALAGIGGASGILCTVMAMKDSRNDDPLTEDERKKSFTRRGPTVGMLMSYAVDTFENDVQSSFRSAADEPLNLSIKDTLGLKSRAGYRCNKYVSSELQLEWLDGFDGSVFQDGAGRILSANYEPIVITANARFYWPIGEGRFQPFAMIGPGLLTLKTKLRSSTGQRNTDRDTEFAIRSGLGLDYYLNSNVVLTIESDYLRGFNKLNDIDYVTVSGGVQYRF